MPRGLASERQGDFAELEETIAYRFAQQRLLREALTHASALVLGRQRRPGKGRRSYERLEFLGDRVLGLAVAHLLIESYPDEAEGGLTHRQSMLVRRDTLAEVAAEIGLARFLEVAHAGRGSGGPANPTILADACEALLGAVFLDGGYAAAATVVRRYWAARVTDLVQSPRDAKTMLQVWALARSGDLPSYTVLDNEGPAHAPVFTVEARLQGVGAATAEAGSKRAAEQAAAALLLEQLGGAASG